MISLLCLFSAGCFAPLHSPGIAARTLPDEYRWPIRTSAAPLNYSQLVGQTQDIYRLGPGDTLQITAPDLISQGHSEPFEVQVLEHGEIYLPRLGAVSVGGLSIALAQQQVNQALANNLLANPCTVITLKQKGTVNVLVLGAVKQQGVHALPRDANDVAHALAAAQGFSEDAGDVIEIHRHARNLPSEMFNAATNSEMPLQNPSGTAAAVAAHNRTVSPVIHASAHSIRGEEQCSAIQLAGYGDSQYGYRSNLALNSMPRPPLNLPTGGHSLLRSRSSGETQGDFCSIEPIVRIPLRGEHGMTNPCDVILNSGDVIVIPRKTDNVFYVVGPLSDRNSVRFTVNDRDREIGGGLLLPDDREIDVVTAVAMAGYIDPIESPTTVTVHRVLPDRRPMLIRVDLIAARSDPQETVMVQPGDIIYLNPDAWWYGRRTFDRIIDRALGTAAGRWLTE